jgi:hypothetical protein
MWWAAGRRVTKTSWARMNVCIWGAVSKTIELGPMFSLLLQSLIFKNTRTTSK